MKIFTVLFFLFGASFLLSSCSTVPTSPSAFTNNNIMKVHQGMGSDEVLALFGEPQNVSVAVCGLPPKQWNCTTWEYQGFFDERAIFTFNDKNGSLRLNNFSIDRN